MRTNRYIKKRNIESKIATPLQRCPRIDNGRSKSRSPMEIYRKKSFLYTCKCTFTFFRRL